MHCILWVFLYFYVLAPTFYSTCKNSQISSKQIQNLLVNRLGDIAITMKSGNNKYSLYITLEKLDSKILGYHPFKGEVELMGRSSLFKRPFRCLHPTLACPGYSLQCPQTQVLF